MVMFTLLRMVLFYAFYVFIALELLHQLHQFVYIWRIYAENKTNQQDFITGVPRVRDKYELTRVLHWRKIPVSTQTRLRDIMSKLPK